MNNLVIGSMPQERRTLNLGEYAEEAVLITEEQPAKQKRPLFIEANTVDVTMVTPTQIRGTNLEIIQGYFESLPLDTMQFVPVNTWYNCNTVSDYNTVYSLIKQHEINK